jgi:hypothetical protein
MKLKDLEEYKVMMQDKVRMLTYRRAIRQMCPGKTVCEIGLGLGPLSLMALQAGATRVYGIEMNCEVLFNATDIIRSHGYDNDRFVPIHGMSTHVSLPERVDVLLSETLDSMGFGENTGLYMEDAAYRLLAPGGVFLPSKVSCFAALASPQSYLRQLYFWEEEMRQLVGVDYQAIIPLLRERSHVIDIEKSELHTDWQLYKDLDFSAPFPARRTHSMLLDVIRPGRVHGLACAFEAQLAPGIVLTNKSEAPRTCWRQGFNPFEKAFEVELGDAAYIEFHVPEQEQICVDFDMDVTIGPKGLIERDLLGIKKAA